MFYCFFTQLVDYQAFVFFWVFSGQIKQKDKLCYDEGMNKEVQHYNDHQDDTNKAICDELAKQIGANLHATENKIWHGAPVWFIDGNPIVGYWVRKQHVQLLFWSGQSFDEPGLLPEGTFKAAEAHYTDVDQINTADLKRWLKKSEDIQWDYKNIVKRKGVLERLK